MAFRVGDDEAVGAVVAGARALQSVTPNMVAQLAASYDRLNDVVRRRELVDELLGEDDLPVPVARLVVSFLLEDSDRGVELPDDRLMDGIEIESSEDDSCFFFFFPMMICPIYF